MSRKTTERDEQIGLAIKTQRVQQGMSRHEMAAKVGVTHQQLQKYENGTNRITVSRMETIAEVLNVPFETLRNMGAEDVCEHDEMGRLVFEHMREFTKVHSREQRVAIHKLTATIVAAQEEIRID